MSVHDSALDYLRRGLAPLPVPHRRKEPILAGWPDLRLTEDNLADYFNGHEQNIGILNGAPSGDLADVDLDAPEAAHFRSWLPPTGMIAGRDGNPASHWFYRAPGLTTAKYQDPHQPEGRTMLIELRSTGTQTLVPPSTHPSGERYRWERDGEPASVDPEDLRRAVGRVAAGALLARHWPGEGARHDASLALAGWMLRGGWGADEAARLIGDIARAASDEEHAARARNVATTARRLMNGGKASGAPTLARLLTGDGRAILDRVAEWLELGGAAERLGETSTSPDSAGRHGPAAPWPAPLAEAAFHGLAGRAVRALEPHTEADPAALLMNFLLMFGSAVGHGPHFMVGDTRHGGNLFAVLVGETAKARKGSSEGGPRRVMRAADAVRDPVEREQKDKETGAVELSWLVGLSARRPPSATPRADRCGAIRLTPGRPGSCRRSPAEVLMPRHHRGCVAARLGAFARR